MAVASPFVWGSGGRMMTPEELEKEQQIADQLAQQGMDFSPVGHWTQGAARVATALAGVVRQKRAEGAKGELADANKAMIASLLGGGGSTVPATVSAAPSPPSAPAPSAPSFAGGGSSRAMTMPVDPELGKAIQEHATAAGIDPVDLATAMSYETAGTFDPWKAGPTTQWGQHRGLIQWGEPQAKQYGVTADMPVRDQVGAAVKYLQDRGVKPGMGLMDIYSAINAGSVGKYNASDANNGGAPGTVADKVNNQMAGHREKAIALLAPLQQAQQATPIQVASADPSSLALPSAPSSPVAPAQPRKIETTAPQQTAQAPGVSPGVQRVAQAAQGLDPNVLNVLTSPYATPATREVAKAIMQQRMQADQLAAQQAYDRMSKAEQRRYDEGVRQQQRAQQVEDRDIAWERERPYKDSSSSIAQGNLDIARERLEIDRNKPSYHNVPAGTTVLGANGQPVFTAPNKDESDKAATELRKEIQQLPSFKNYSQAVPIYRSMAETAGRNTKASDLNLVYGLGKIMDPTSVVREGEMVMVKNTAGLPEWLVGSINALNGGAALTPETRNAIMTEAYGRMNGYAGQFQQEIGQYKGIIERRGFNPDDVIPNFGDITPYEPLKTGRDKPAPAQSAQPQPPNPDKDGWVPAPGGVRIREKR